MSDLLQTIVKVVNIVLAVICVIAGIFNFIWMNDGYSDIAQMLMPIYLVLFGLMMMAGDFGWHHITSRCTFMHDLVGRGLFDIFVASILYSSSYGWSYGGGADTLNFIIVVASAVLAGFGVVLIICAIFCSDKGHELLGHWQYGIL